MKLASVTLAALLAACCTTKTSDNKPGPLDKAVDVAVPLAKGYLCSQPAPPPWAPDAPWMEALWAAARAVFCVPPAPIDADAGD